MDFVEKLKVHYTQTYVDLLVALSETTDFLYENKEHIGTPEVVLTNSNIDDILALAKIVDPNISRETAKIAEYFENNKESIILNTEGFGSAAALARDKIILSVRNSVEDAVVDLKHEQSHFADKDKYIPFLGMKGHAASTHDYYASHEINPTLYHSLVTKDLEEKGHKSNFNTIVALHHFRPEIVVKIKAITDAIMGKPSPMNAENFRDWLVEKNDMRYYFAATLSPFLVEKVIKKETSVDELLNTTGKEYSSKLNSLPNSEKGIRDSMEEFLGKET
ncbi:MAG: hypothetical protein FWE31_02595 [Firmicutes bacterium]|nr:hypothetical protein [Bacillota bacterium]